MKLFDDIDFWVFKTAENPTVFAFIIGLAFGTIILPEAWKIIKRRTQYEMYKERHDEFLDEFNGLADDRENFWRLFQEAFRSWQHQNEPRDSIQRLNPVCDSAEFPDFLPVPNGENISAYVYTNEQSLKRKSSKKLWNFTASLAVETEKFRDSDGDFLFGKDDRQEFFTVRRNLAKFWNRQAQYILSGELPLSKVSPVLSQQGRLLKVLSYIEATRAKEREEQGPGKAWLFTIARRRFRGAEQNWLLRKWRTLWRAANT